MSSRLAVEALAALDCPSETQPEVAAWTSLVTAIDPSANVFGFAPAPAPASPSSEELAVRERISSLTALNASTGATALAHGQRDEVQLTVCGMASIYLALRIALLAEEQTRTAATAPPKVHTPSPRHILT